MTKKNEKTTKAVAMPKLINGVKDIEAAIASIQKAGKKLDRNIHIAGLSILNHIEEHGDITLAQRLIDAMPLGSRHHAMREWFIAFGKLKWNMKEKAFEYDKKATTDLEAANKKPFYEFRAQKAADFKPFNLEVEIAKLISRAEKRMEKAEEGDDIPTATLDNLRKLTKAEAKAAKQAV